MKKKKKPKSGGITRHHMTRVLYVSLVGFALATALILGIYAQAAPAQAATPSFLDPYGGSVKFAQANTNLAGALVCPVYTLIDNADPGNGLPSEFGIYIPKLPPATTYDYNNLFVPGTPILGELLPIPCPGSSLVPIYPIFFDGSFYLTGTGAF